MHIPSPKQLLTYKERAEEKAYLAADVEQNMAVNDPSKNFFQSWVCIINFIQKFNHNVEIISKSSTTKSQKTAKYDSV